MKILLVPLVGFVALASSVILISCKSTTTPGTNGTSTNYSYTGKDSSGAVFVTGTFTIPRTDTSSVSGTWKFDSVPGASENKFGPQFGSGTWVGGLFTAGHMIVEMNPLMADNNVSLSGTLTSTQYSGNWSYSTLKGEVNHGTFTAVRE